MLGTFRCYDFVNAEQNTELRDDGEKDTQAEGYHLAAAMAGRMSANPIGGVLTRRTLAGFSRIGYADRYFSRNNLRTIAGGSLTVLTQATENAPIVISHALTTDASSFENQELTMSLARDWLLYLVDAVVSPIVAAENITPNYIERVETAVEAVFTRALEQEEEPFLNLTLLSVQQSPNIGGTVVVDFEVEQAEPANNISVTVYY